MCLFNKTNMWILTEERPKKEVLKKIIEKICSDKGFNVNFKEIIIKPLMEDKKFTFTYQLLGVECNKIEDIFIKIVSGSGSFVDFLIFLQKDRPSENDKPLYAIEETKTDDSESRNTGVYQRCSKFVYLDFYYPDTKKIMLYNLRVAQKEKPTQTNIFGTRMLLTLGVEIMGKNLDSETFKKFEGLDEFIQFKSQMRKAPTGNVPISIKKNAKSIEVSGRLYKSDSLSHDPNIGALSIISETLRKLGWDKEIIITHHGLSQKHLANGNKFIRIANKLGVKLKDLILPKSNFSSDYWHYEINSEKISTIFLHLILEEINGVKSIYENHAGCERGYLLCPNRLAIPIHKYIGNKKVNGKIPKLPDLIVLDLRNKQILEIEGKTHLTVQDGINEIKLFGTIEKEYLNKFYPNFKIEKGVVLYGGRNTQINQPEVLFLLNSNGEIIISDNTPEVIKEALKNISNP